MTRKEFIKRKWSAYQEIDYKNSRNGYVIACLLVQVDFDTELMKLQIIDKSWAEVNNPTETDFFAHIKDCEIARKRLRLSKKILRQQSPPTPPLLPTSTVLDGSYWI